MDAPAYFMLGFLTYFMLNRFIDALCFRAGRECSFDCSKCDLHCAGYVCHKHRIQENDVSFPDNLQEKLDGLREYLDSEVTPTESENQSDSDTFDSD